jgi:hypothetical protein
MIAELITILVIHTHNKGVITGFEPPVTQEMIEQAKQMEVKENAKV